VLFHIGNAQVEPEELLTDESEYLDLAVFDVSEYTPENLGIGGEIPTNFKEVDLETPPDVPAEGSYVMFGGYPKGRRRAEGRNVEWASFNTGGARVDQSTGRNVVCRLLTDKDVMERAGFPSGPIPELGGISGGPVLQERATESGIIIPEIIGFIYEHGNEEAELDLLMIRPITYLNPDGTLNDPNR